MELFQPSAMALNERTIPGQLGRPFPTPLTEVLLAKYGPCSPPFV